MHVSAQLFVARGGGGLMTVACQEKFSAPPPRPAPPVIINTHETYGITKMANTQCASPRRARGFNNWRWMELEVGSVSRLRLPKSGKHASNMEEI